MLKILCIFGFVFSSALWINNIVNDVVSALQSAINPFEDNKQEENLGKSFMVVRVILAFLMALCLTGIICL